MTTTANVGQAAASAENGTMLVLDDVNTYYGNIHALQGISMEVRQGEIVTLIGANGAGKTTTLKTISGLMHPRRGSVTFEDRNISRTAAHELVQLGIGHAPEGRRIFSRMTVLENLLMGAYTRDQKTIQPDVDRVMELFPRLRERTHQLGGTLSGGEQQMLAIGRALMSEPRLLLLDEPSLGLSPILVQQVFATIKEINEQGTTVLLVEQNALQALSIANRAYVLQTGNVVLTGPASEVRDERVRAQGLPRRGLTADGMDPSGPSDGPRPGRRTDGVFSAAAVTTDRPHIGQWLAVVLIAVALVVVKPWDDPASSGDGADDAADAGPSRAGAGVVTTALPDIVETATAAEVAGFCLNPTVWLVATVELWRDHTIRVWRYVEPSMTATGPDDPAIPVMEVVSEGATELGWCAPIAGAGRPGDDSEITAWAGAPARPFALEERRIRPAGAGSPLGAMYAPTADAETGVGAVGSDAPTEVAIPPSASPPDIEPEVWADGRYVIRLGDGAATTRWFAIDLQTRARVLVNPPA